MTTEAISCPSSLYRAGWWTYDLLFICNVDDNGESLAEILERCTPIKAKLFDCNLKVVAKELKDFNKKSKYVKYNMNGIYLERM